MHEVWIKGRVLGATTAQDVNEAAKYFGIILRKDGEMPTLEMARRIATAAIDMADSNHDRALSKYARGWGWQGRSWLVFVAQPCHLLLLASFSPSSPFPCPHRKEFASALIGTLRSGLAPVMKVHEAQHTIMLLSTVRHTIKELGAGYPTAAMIEELKMNVYARLHDVLDVDRSGDLDRSEVRRFLQLALLPSLYPPETDLESLTRERWDALDWNKDGRCDRSEWIRGMETLRADFHLSEVQMIGLIVGTFIPVIQDS